MKGELFSFLIVLFIAILFLPLPFTAKVCSCHGENAGECVCDEGWRWFFGYDYLRESFAGHLMIFDYFTNHGIPKEIFFLWVGSSFALGALGMFIYIKNPRTKVLGVLGCLSTLKI